MTALLLQSCSSPRLLTCSSNQAVDPTCSALVAAGFCHAKVPQLYGDTEIYAVSRENPDCDGIGSGCLSAAETRDQTCAIACDKFRAKYFRNDRTDLWGAAVDAGGHPVGTADMGALFVPFGRASDTPVRAVGGRPQSPYLEGSGSAYADWCCCYRGFNPRAVVPTTPDRPPKQTNAPGTPDVIR